MRFSKLGRGTAVAFQRRQAPGRPLFNARTPWSAANVGKVGQLGTPVTTDGALFDPSPASAFPVRGGFVESLTRLRPSTEASIPNPCFLSLHTSPGLPLSAGTVPGHASFPFSTLFVHGPSAATALFGVAVTSDSPCLGPPDPSRGRQRRRGKFHNEPLQGRRRRGRIVRPPWDPRLGPRSFFHRIGPSRLGAAAAAMSWKKTDKVMDIIRHYASFPATGVSLRQMVQFGEKPSIGRHWPGRPSVARTRLTDRRQGRCSAPRSSSPRSSPSAWPTASRSSTACPTVLTRCRRSRRSRTGTRSRSRWAAPPVRRFPVGDSLTPF